MKKFLSIALMFVVLIQPIQKMWIMVAFEMNQAFIAKNMCEKKDEVPQIAMRCAGSCQLRQELQQLDEKSSTSTTTQGISYDLETLFFQDIEVYSFENEVINEFFIEFFTSYHPPFSSYFFSELLQPPIH